MFFKSVLLVASLAISQVALATPPACLLGAVGSQTNPADLKSICSNSTKIESSLSSGCGDSVNAAMSAFSSVCSSVGVTVCTSTTISPIFTSSSSLPISSNHIVTDVPPSSYDNPIPSFTATYSHTVSASLAASSTGSASGNATVTGSGGSNSTGASATATGGSASATGGSNGNSGSSGSTGSSSTSSASDSQSTGAAGKVELSSFAAMAIAGMGLMVAL